MFKHTQHISSDSQTGNPAPAIVEVANAENPAPATKAEPDLRELIEKNLKWSQIIYEQNRKINNKLLWAAIAEWLKIFLIVVPLILGIWFMAPLLKNVWSQYSELLGTDNTVNTSDQKSSSFDNLLKLFKDLDPAKQQQLKALLQ